MYVNAKSYFYACYILFKLVLIFTDPVFKVRARKNIASTQDASNKMNPPSHPNASTIKPIAALAKAAPPK